MAIKKLSLVTPHIILPPPHVDGSMQTNQDNLAWLSQDRGVEILAISTDWKLGDGITISSKKWAKENKSLTGIKYAFVQQEYEYEGQAPSLQRISEINQSLDALLDANYQGRDLPDIAVIGHDSWVWHREVFQKRGIPVAVRLLGTPTRDINNLYSEDAAARFQLEVLKCDYVFPLNPVFESHVYEWAERYNQDISGRVSTFYDGTHLTRFKVKGVNTKLRRSLGIQDDQVVIMHASGHFPVKNVPLIVESANEVLRYHNDRVTYVIVGDGPQGNDVRELIAKSPYKNKILHVGSQPQDLMPGYHQMADIFVFASENEGLGRVVMESQATATFTVVSDMPISDYLVKGGKFGYVFKRGDVIDLARKTMDAINLNLQNPLLFRNMALEAAVHVHANCNIEVNMPEFYDRLIEIAGKGVGNYAFN